MKKHILIISLHADPMLPAGIGEYGGGHMYPYELLVGLAKEDYRVSVITRKSCKEFPCIDYVNEFATIYRLDYGDLTFYDKRDFYRLRDISYKLTQNVLQEHNIQPDIIHSLYWNSGFLAFQLAEQLKIPYVHSPISLGAVIRNEKAKKIEPNRIATEQIVFENASQILSITESEKENIIQYYNIPKEKIAVIGRPIPDEYKYPVHDEWGNTRDNNMNYLASPEPIMSYPLHEDENWWERKAFIYVGRIHPNKGIHYIIRAWIKLKETYGDLCPPLWLVGGTPAEINQFHIEQNLHLHSFEKNGQIIWWGRLNAEGISTLYTRCLAFIMHSKYEPGGRVSVEAMTAGLPVIATPCGFAKDMVKDWETGFLVEFGNIDQLFHRMSLFIRQPYLANSLGNNAKLEAAATTAQWGFMQHHIFIYEQLTSMNCDASLNYKPFLTKDNRNWGIVNTYPVSSEPVSASYLLQHFQYLGIESIVLNTHKTLPICNCYLWTAQGNNKSYYILQPYNSINILRLLDMDCYSKLLYAETAYSRAKKWANFFPTSLLLFDDQNMVLIHSGTLVFEFNTSNFTSIIALLENCKHSVSPETKEFSISYETKWLLNKMSENNKIQFPSRSKCLLEEWVDDKAETNFVLGGLIYPGSVCRQNEKLCFSAPISIRTVENGYDEGALLILTASKHQNLVIWRELIKEIPITYRCQSVQWAFIFLSKYLLLVQAMDIDCSYSVEIMNQLNILTEILLCQND